MTRSPDEQMDASLLIVLQCLADGWQRHIRWRLWNCDDMEFCRLSFKAVVASAFGQSKE